MDTLDQKLLQTILAEIDSHLSQGILPVHNGHLKDLSKEKDVLDCLLLMKKQGLISGDLVTKGTDSTPYRMTNIRLTYLGIKVLRT
ncbi:MAG TPA: hypothetical protein VFF31_15480 [Blastocatellia bacterium]|nr:hypothetical protein [Blastocatellia bacterium]